MSERGWSNRAMVTKFWIDTTRHSPKQAVCLAFANKSPSDEQGRIAHRRGSRFVRTTILRVVTFQNPVGPQKFCGAKNELRKLDNCALQWTLRSVRQAGSLPVLSTIGNGSKPVQFRVEPALLSPIPRLIVVSKGGRKFFPATRSSLSRVGGPQLRGNFRHHFCRKC